MPPDGAERLLVDILKNRSTEFKFVVVCLVAGGLLVNELEKLGVEVIILGRTGKYDLKIIIKLVNLIKRYKPLVVHTHLFTADLWGRLAAFISKVPCVVTTIHSTNTWKTGVHKIIDYLLSLITSKIIACSSEVAQVLIKKGRVKQSRIIVIDNGIDLTRFENVNPVHLKSAIECVKLVIIGRLHPAKGHLDLLLALRELQKYDLNYHIYFVGEGELQSTIEENCVKYDLNNHITLLGQRTDVPNILQAADIFVMPSHWEGLPMALLEAMAMSLPVIATSVGGIPNVINDGVNGMLIAKGDYQLLANKLRLLINNKKLREELGARAKLTVYEKYNAQFVSIKYEKVYNDELQKCN